MLNWLDQRAGVRKLVGAMLLEGVPGGAKWRYVWGSCLAFVFSLQLITGILLMTAYSPSASQAWNSVHAIQYKMDFGWLIRGLHHFGSQTMMVLIALHMLQVVIAGAHLPPREINWWLGMGLLGVTFGLSLTGYLLPWDQKGYWATTVATNIAGTLPEVGGEVRHQAVAGPDYGNYTLTRFYALHVAILPLSLIGLLVAHIAIFRRHGVTSPQNQEGLVAKPENEHAPGSEPFWPRQAFFDMMACMAVFAVMLSMVLYGFAHPVDHPSVGRLTEDLKSSDAPTRLKAATELGELGASARSAIPALEPLLQDPDEKVRDAATEATNRIDSWYGKIARAGVYGKGAELDAAADRDTTNYPARPEWYFLFLFQLLKYFPGEHAIWGTVIIPNGAAVLLVLLPLFGYGGLRKVGHFFGLFVMVALLVMVGLLTLKALDDDRPDGILWGIMKNTNDEEGIEKAKKHQHSVHDAEAKARRACELAMPGSPVDGGHMLIRNDPYLTGRDLFQQRCGNCHAFTALPSDKFTRQLLSVKYEPELTEAHLAEMRKELKKKNITLSEKVELKPLEEGTRWRLDDKETNWVYFVDRRGSELDLSTTSMTDGKTASDLGDFGSKAWIRGLLDNPMDDKYFGRVKKTEREEGKEVKDEKGNVLMRHALTQMKSWRAGFDRAREKGGKEVAVKQDADLDAIADLLTELRKAKDHPDPSRRPSAKVVEKGEAAFERKGNRCAECHGYDKEIKENGKAKTDRFGANIGEAPDFTAYGGADWLRSMIMRPMHPRHYGERNRFPDFRMPAFRPLEGPGSELSMKEFRETNADVKDSEIQHLTDIERELIIRWILRDYRPVYGGATIQ